MTNKVREFFDFAMNEPECVGDMFEMLRDMKPEDLRTVEKISGSVLNAVRSVKAKKLTVGEVSPKEL